MIHLFEEPYILSIHPPVCLSLYLSLSLLISTFAFTQQFCPIYLYLLILFFLFKFYCLYCFHVPVYFFFFLVIHRTQYKNKIYRIHFTHHTITVEIIQWHKSIMIEYRKVQCNIFIRAHHKMVTYHLSQFHHQNRKIIAQWFKPTVMETMEICHQVNGIHRYVYC